MGTQPNEFDLMNRSKAVSDRLEKMRKKLAAGPAPHEPKPESSGARRRRASGRAYKWVIFAGIALVGINVLAISRKDVILQAIGAQVIVKPLSPPPGLELDELARFWAYAAFDAAKLKSRFAIPKNVLIDPLDARHHLADILSRGRLGEKTLAEISLLRNGIPGKAVPGEPMNNTVPVERMRGAVSPEAGAVPAQTMRSTVPPELINSAIPTVRPE